MVIDIRETVVAAKWDFHVPGYNNYWCGGAIHHNSGKTHSSMAEASAHALGYRPWLAEDDPHYRADIHVPNKGLLVAESFDKVKTVLVSKLLGDPESGWPGMIPKAEIAKTKKNQQGVVNFIQLKNGSTMSFQSYDQDVGLFESSDYDYVAFDEPPPQGIFKAVWRGLTDRLGRAWLAMTPLKEPWVKEQLVDAEHVSTHIFFMDDNVGFGLTQQGVDEFIRELDDDEIKARRFGEFLHLQGLVYRTYVRNAQKVFRRPREKLLTRNHRGQIYVPRSWGLCMSIDPHPKTPHRAVWATPRPDGNLIVCGELINQDPENRVDAFADDILAYETDFLHCDYQDEITRLIDPSSQINNPVDGNSIWDAFADKGIICEMGSKDLQGCIAQTKKRMAYDADKGLFPTIFMCEDLVELDRELRGYVWEEWLTKLGQQKNEKNVPRDKNDHLIECLHRIVKYDPEPPPVIGAEQDQEYSRSVGATGTGY